jgi:hypothetical protein
MQISVLETDSPSAECREEGSLRSASRTASCAGHVHPNGHVTVPATTFSTPSRRPAGTLAPPTRRTAALPLKLPLWQRRTPVGWREKHKARAAMTYRSHQGLAAKRATCSRCRNCPDRARTCQDRLRRRLRRSSTLDTCLPAVAAKLTLHARVALEWLQVLSLCFHARSADQSECQHIRDARLANPVLSLA